MPQDKLELDIQPTYLDFTAYSNTRKASYHVKLDLYAEIEPKETRLNHTTRSIELVLQKKELKQEFWPRLLKEKSKVHFLKTDFDKWVDEDEQDEAPEDDDYMSRMGGKFELKRKKKKKKNLVQAANMVSTGMGAGAGGMPDMGGMGGMPGMGGMGGMGGEGFGGIDFSKLGGAGGMPDFSNMGDMANMAGMGGDESDDDDDMPELEGEDKSADAATSGETGASATETSSKIEEIE